MSAKALAMPVGLDFARRVVVIPGTDVDVARAVSVVVVVVVVGASVVVASSVVVGSFVVVETLAIVGIDISVVEVTVLVELVKVSSPS